MIITLKDGSKKEYAEAKSVIDIAADISEGLARVACAGEVDGEVVDLRHVVDKDCELSILTFEDEGGKGAFRHTTSHIMAQAIKRLYPDVKLAIGPSIADGFYYDIDKETPLTAEDLDKIEAEMKKIVKENLEIKQYTMPREEAIAYFKEKNEPYKVELIEDLPEGETISFYSQGEFTDLCAGPHLMTTKPVKAFKLTSLAGAYWRGDEHNKMLQRVYGTAFSKKAELEEYLTMIEEAKKRGAIALFGEKYGKVVRVVDIEGWSTEFCGGTHVSNSGQIGLFKIVSESSVAAGVRRITAVTGAGLLAYLDVNEALVKGVSAALKTGENEVQERVNALMNELKDKEKEIKNLNAELAKLRSADAFSKPISVCGLELYVARVDGSSPEALRSMGDDLKAKGENVVGVVAGAIGDKASIVAVCGKEAIAKGVKAGNLVKEIAKLANGGGGGRPDSAMAGAKDVSKLDDALAAAKSIVEGFAE